MSAAERLTKQLSADAATALLDSLLESRSATDWQASISRAIDGLSIAEQKAMRNRLVHGVGDFRTELLSMLSRHIIDESLGPEEAQLIEKMGTDGLLRSDLYDIRIDERALSSVRARGVGAAHLRDTLAHPDSVQHLQGPEGWVSAEGNLSLFLKHGLKSNRGAFTLLALSFRIGKQQDLADAFPLLGTDATDSGPLKPLEALRICLGRFAASFRFSGSPESSGSSALHLYERILVNSLEIGILLDGEPRPVETRFYLAFPNGLIQGDPTAWKVEQPAEIEVVIGYAVDQAAGQRYLKKHAFV